MSNPDFSNRITLLRKEKGYSQKFAASQMGVSQALLSHYEKGIRECGLAFLVRCADFYNVSCDYLLGRSPERSGSTISIDDIPEVDTVGAANKGKNLMPILNKKLMVNSLGIIFDLLSKTDNKTLINEASAYMMMPIYRVFRLLFTSNAKNEKGLFSIPDEISSQMIFAALSRSDAAMVGCISRLSMEDLEPLKEEGRPLLNSDRIEEQYAAQATSLFNLIQNIEKKISK